MKQHRMYHFHPQSELRIKNSRFETPVRVNNNLGIPILSLIKFVISNLGTSEIDFVRDHKARLRLASNDHITQVPIVGFDVALTSAKRQSLQLIRIKTQERHKRLTFSKSFPKLRLIMPFAVAASGAPGSLREETSASGRDISIGNIPRNIKTRNTHSSASACNTDHVLEYNIRLLGRPVRVNGLVANGIDGPVNHPAAVGDDLVDGIALREIDRDASNLFGGCEALGDSVDDINEGCATQDG